MGIAGQIKLDVSTLFLPDFFKQRTTIQSIRYIYFIQLRYDDLRYHTITDFTEMAEEPQLDTYQRYKTSVQNFRDWLHLVDRTTGTRSATE